MKLPIIKVPSLSVGPIIRKAQQPTPPKILMFNRPEPPDENELLQMRSKAEEEKAMETYWDNEQRAANPAGNPTWILKPPQAGRDKTFKD